MKKVLITGAGGFVGKYLIKEFRDNNYDVIACDINKGNDFCKDVTYYDMNILDKQRIEEILDKTKPDYIINLAAISSVGMSWSIPEKTMEVNIIGMLNILEAVRKVTPTSKVMLIGSSEEYEAKDKPLKEKDKVNSNNPYGISKVAGENIAKMYKERYGMNIICTRSFNHTGPRTAR